MPIYEYQCEKCGKIVDVLQKVDDPAPGTCESCGAKGKMSRQVSRTSFVLKGGGWYSDLYGSTKKDSAKSETPPSSSSPSSSGSAASSPGTSGSDKGGSSSGGGSSPASGSGSGSGSGSPPSGGSSARPAQNAA